MPDNLTTQNLPVSPPVAGPGHAPPPTRPVAVASLAYSTPGVRNRPGLLTAIGVMSIVIASFSLVASLVTGLQAVGFYFIAAAAGAAAAPTRPTAAVPAPATVAWPGPTTAPATGATTAPTTGPTTAPAAAGPALTPAQVQTIIQRVQAATSNGLNPAQVAALQTALQDPAQELVTPGTAWSPLVSVHLDGTDAFIHLSGGWIELDAQGKVVDQFSTTRPFSRLRLSLAAVVLVAAEAAASALLAVLLLVAGILVFRRSPLSRRLHLLYAWIKIPTALVGAAGLGWLFASFVGAFTPGANQSAEMTVFWTWALGAAALGCAYPVGLLFALRSAQVRAYYNSISAG